MTPVDVTPSRALQALTALLSASNVRLAVGFGGLR
jgi:hypothetical protein